MEKALWKNSNLKVQPSVRISDLKNNCLRKLYNTERKYKLDAFMNFIFETNAIECLISVTLRLKK